ncbi:TOMM precursor leader peptide-binding protein [Cellulosimicrobium sp. PMB13]|uniref:TOMM precursor leader peptide-binding protein n=1 Tax=Cellulosimicrobium sp. PMB13 TaxID=3120158 RepID=UPI003F4B1A25
MSVATAGPRAPAPMHDLFTGVRDQLRRALTLRASERGVAEPQVAVLGAQDVLTAPDPARRDATVHVAGGAVLVGPRGAGSCGHCLGTRWQRLRARTHRDALETGTGLTPVGEWPVLPAYVVDAVWHLYEAMILADAPPTLGASEPASRELPLVASLDLATLVVRNVALLPDPRCPSCGVREPDGPRQATVRLEERVKASPGSYRQRGLDDYPLPESALANPVCGALGAGTMMTVTSPTTAPVSGSVFIRGYGGLLDVSWSGQANSYATSRRLALIEGLERYAGTHRRRNAEPVMAAYTDLEGFALDPSSCGFYPPAAYEADPMIAPFSASAVIPWVWGYSLRDERPILVPRRLSHYSSGAEHDNFVLTTSNGCATGSTLEEAVLHGVLELVERDAFLVGWYGNADLPEIDLASVPSAVVTAMADRAELQGYRVHAFDNRIDMRIPAVTALAVRSDGGLGMLSFAAAAHFDPVRAIEGAIEEALTYLPHQAKTTATRRKDLEAMARDYSLVQGLPDHAALFGLPGMSRFADSYLHPSRVSTLDALFREWEEVRPRSLDLRDDLRACLDELADYDVIVVDQTAPEQEPMGLRTVCVIVPGLVPFDFGWTRQRALTMPRTRSALQTSGALSAGDLRRVPHPFP